MIQNFHQPSLRDRFRAVIRLRRYSHRTEQAYWYWIRQFINYHGKRHPLDMAEPEIRKFLSSLTIERNVSASTQNQALNALVSSMTRYSIDRLETSVQQLGLNGRRDYR